MENRSEYSDSVNAMNGCLIGCADLLGMICGWLLIIILAPYVGLLFLIWWIVAWILGLIFPGRIKRYTGLNLESVLLITALFLLADTAIGVIANLFRGGK